MAQEPSTFQEENARTVTDKLESGSEDAVEETEVMPTTSLSTESQDGQVDIVATSDTTAALPSTASLLRRNFRGSGATLTPAASNESDLAALIPSESYAGPTSTPRRSGFTEAELAEAMARTTPQSNPRGPHPSPSDSLPSSPAVARTTRERQKRRFEDIREEDEEDEEEQGEDDVKRPRVEEEGGDEQVVQSKSDGKKRLFEEMRDGDQGDNGNDKVTGDDGRERLFQDVGEGGSRSGGDGGAGEVGSGSGDGSAGGESGGDEMEN